MAGTLKEIAPATNRVAVVRDPAVSAGLGFFGAIQAAAPSLGVELTPISMRDVGEIERSLAAFARSPNGGLIVAGSALAYVHSDLIFTLAARHKLPAVYFARSFVTEGGLMSYGADFIDQYRRGRLCRSRPPRREAGRPAGSGADQIRAGHQSEAAKALGLTVPAALLTRADEVIE